MGDNNISECLRLLVGSGSTSIHRLVERPQALRGVAEDDSR